MGESRWLNKPRGPEWSAYVAKLSEVRPKTLLLKSYDTTKMPPRPWRKKARPAHVQGDE